MPIFNRIKGNLLDLFEAGEFDGIAHGCNCFHTMGAGIAQKIAEKYPEAAEADVAHHTYGLGVTGAYSEAKTPDGIIYNLYTQYRPGKQHAGILMRNISDCFLLLNKNLPVKPHRHHIGIPLIGAGIAGGKWAEIEPLINEATPKLLITVVEYQP